MDIDNSLVVPEGSGLDEIAEGKGVNYIVTEGDSPLGGETCK